MKTIKEGLRKTHIKKLRRKLIKCCYWYYVKSEPLISDYAFDMLFKELETLEKISDCVFYPTPYSPTQMIYGDLESQYPAWAKITNMFILYNDEIPKRPVKNLLLNDRGYRRDKMINTIIQGDFREIIGNINGDYIVITDPPYNINFKGYKQEYQDNMPSEEYIEMLSYFQNKPVAIIDYPEEMMKYVVPALGTPNEVLCWCYNSNIPRRFRLVNIYNCVVNFHRILQPYKNPNDKRVKKLITNGQKGTPIYDWFSDIQLVKNVSKQKTDHPCPIHIELAKRLITLLTEKGDLVLDPFCGGGTFCLAAKQLGRNYIGIDISEKYCNIARQSIIKRPRLPK